MPPAEHDGTYKHFCLWHPSYRLFLVLLLFLLFLLSDGLISAQQQPNNDDIRFTGCSVDEYYSELLAEDVWTRQGLSVLLTLTHRQVLPYTDSDEGDDDVWKALIDLDPGNNSTIGTVQLIYRATATAAQPHGTPDTWNREHLWPQSRGVGDLRAAFTDVHHLRPADWNVNSARSNRYFGDCTVSSTENTESSGSDCEVPAHAEAAPDTAKDAHTFLPPTAVRGDIARALFYMELRYGDDGLRLTDCPDDSNEQQMAYLSVLLQWHANDPVSDAERERNQRVCERWQGNRNPLVDQPELVPLLFGTPVDDGGACQDGSSNNNNNSTGSSTNPPTTVVPTYPSTPTLSPTLTNNNNDDDADDACANLSPGDILFVTVRSDNPDVVALVALRDIPSSIDLVLTDNAWIASTQEFRTNEGTVQLSGRNMAAGTVFGYALASSTAMDEVDPVLYSNEWTNVAGSFALSAADGDNLYLYCQRTNGAVHFLAALTTGGDWVYEDNDDNNQDSSGNTALTALPVALQSAALALPHYDNYQYTGTVTGTKANLQQQLLDATNWVGSNTPQPDSAPPEAFNVIMTTTPESDGLLQAGDVMVVAVHSDNPDLVALVALTDVAAGTRLSITDNAWTGTAFRRNEGTLVLRVPEPGISRGTVFGYGAGLLRYGDQWTAAEDDAGFALSAEGDTLVVYSTTATATTVDDAVAGDSVPPHHLGAFSFNGPWMPAGLEDEEDYGTDSSALPAALVEFSTALSHSDNYVYVGPMSGTKGAIQAALRDPSNWQGSNSVLVFGESTLSSSMSFEILQETSGVGVRRTFSHGFVLFLLLGLWLLYQ